MLNYKIYRGLGETCKIREQEIITNIDYIKMASLPGQVISFTTSPSGAALGFIKIFILHHRIHQSEEHHYVIISTLNYPEIISFTSKHLIYTSFLYSEFLKQFCRLKMHCF